MHGPAISYRCKNIFRNVIFLLEHRDHQIEPKAVLFTIDTNPEPLTPSEVFKSEKKIVYTGFINHLLLGFNNNIIDSLFISDFCLVFFSNFAFKCINIFFAHH